MLKEMVTADIYAMKERYLPKSLPVCILHICRDASASTILYSAVFPSPLRLAEDSADSAEFEGSGMALHTLIGWHLRLGLLVRTDTRELVHMT
jgi:hypothetical protein